jgi:hypothetical protein
MKWICRFLPHKWEWVNSTMFRNYTERNWECKRCGEKDVETVWHDI